MNLKNNDKNNQRKRLSLLCEKWGIYKYWKVTYLSTSSIRHKFYNSSEPKKNDFTFFIMIKFHIRAILVSMFNIYLRTISDTSPDDKRYL